MKIASILFIVLTSLLVFLQIKTDKELKLTKSVEPEIVILPKTIYPGDPIMISVAATSSVTRITLDSKEIPFFEYDSKPTSFFGIPIEETKLNHTTRATLSNGIILERDIVLIPRPKIEKPLGIPEKLGGNTPAASRNLIKNLGLENAKINAIVATTTPLWVKPFKSPLLDLRVTDAYGYTRNTVGSPIIHKGTDFRAIEGTTIRAMNAGIVRVSENFTVYGNTVIIDHGLGITSLYMHLSEANVKVGDKVFVGQVIGLSGQSGYAEAAHLHISIKINGVSIDPGTFLHFFGVL